MVAGVGVEAGVALCNMNQAYLRVGYDKCTGVSVSRCRLGKSSRSISLSRHLSMGFSRGLSVSRGGNSCGGYSKSGTGISNFRRSTSISSTPRGYRVSSKSLCKTGHHDH